MNTLPDVKLRAMVALPPSIRNGLGVNVEKKNGIYTFLLDYSDIDKKQSIPVDEYPQTWQLFWNDESSLFTLVPYTLPSAKITGTSTTSNTVATGTFNFSVEPGIGWTVGTRLRFADTSAPATYVEGIVSSYDALTGALELVADRSHGSGTVSGWSASVIGDHGSGDLFSTSNLSDLDNIASARANLGDFATVAAMEAASVTAVQVRLTTAGYAAAGDGGPWQAKRVSTPGVVKPWHRQTTDGAWWQLDVSTVFPRHFGAALDGATDDTVAIQAWADYASTFNVKAVGQPGVANIPTGQLVLLSNTTIEGGFLTLKRSTATVLSLVKGSAVSNVRIRDLTLQHTGGMSSTTSVTMGLTTKNFNIGTGVVGLVVNQFVQISAVTDPRNYEIARINSYSGGVLNVTATTSVGSGTFANWYIDSYPLNGDTAESNIAIYLVGCSKVWVENCVVNGRFYNGLDSRDGNDIRFLENNIDGAVNRGIHMAAYSALSNNNRCVGNGVYGNSITQYGINTSGTGAGILQSCHVSGNTVSQPMFQGIEMGGKAQWCSIAGNKVFMNVGAGYGVGILVQAVGSDIPRSITVDGNAVQGGEYCIAVQDSFYWSVTGNRVTSGQTGYFIYGSAAGSNVYGTLSGNGADNCADNAYLLSAAVLDANVGHAITGNSGTTSGTGFAIGSNNTDIALVGNVSKGNMTAYTMAAGGGSTNTGNV